MLFCKGRNLMCSLISFLRFHAAAASIALTMGNELPHR